MVIVVFVDEVPPRGRTMIALKRVVLPFSGCFTALMWACIFHPAFALAQGGQRDSINESVSASATSKPRRAALTVEGGGTLGTYEAGLTWTLVEIFRQQRLVLGKPDDKLSPQERTLKSFASFDFKAAAGASAGSINAFIAAARWCSSDPPKTERTSPFWLVWVPTGVKKLLPKQEPSDWNEQKAVLTREIFAPILAELDDSLQQSAYEPGCTTPLFGASLTRLASDSLQIPPFRFSVRNQRFASAFAIKLRQDKNRRVSFARIPNRSEIPFGAFAELPDSTDGEIAGTTVHEVLKASSGYPLAFAPQPITYCIVGDRPIRRADPLRCPAGLDSRRAYFVDGGVFDNGPLTIGYGLALTQPGGALLDSLYMLFVTPNRCRTTSDRCGFAGLRVSPRRSPSPLPVESNADEDQVDGLDALGKLLSVSIPSARQYELQVIGRTIPMVVVAHNKEAANDAAVKRVSDEVSRYQRRDLLQFRRDSITFAAAQADLADLRKFSDQLQIALVRCRLQACDPSDSSLLNEYPKARLDSFDVLPRLPLETPNGSVFPRQSEAGFLIVTDRWHPLAGDWLFGFGGFLGRPLREYDFYVGVYDALVVMSRQMSVEDHVPAREHLRMLVAEPPILMSRTARVTLRALYHAEFGVEIGSQLGARDLDPMPQLSDSLLIGIVQAMRTLSDSLPPVKRCAGGPIERIECSEGLDVAFAAMRSLPYFQRALEAARAECETSSSREVCRDDDETFDDFLANPYGSLNRIIGHALERLLDATPPASGLRMPLTIASATYFATNERARTGLDQGSVSLPPGFLPMRRRLLWLVPSSIGGFGGIAGWYSEWTGRWHYDASTAIGVAARFVWSSGLAGPASPNGRHTVPSVRVERKWGGAPSLVFGTLGFDLAYWADWHHGGFKPGRGERKAWSFGFTSAMFAEKLRLSLGYRPTKYQTRTHSTSRVLFSIGAGDVTGMLYWIYRSFDH